MDANRNELIARPSSVVMLLGVVAIIPVTVMVSFIVLFSLGIDILFVPSGERNVNELEGLECPDSRAK
ncbi:hypothetical protein GCM10009563_00170 [Subtercola frigoramans]